MSLTPAPMLVAAVLLAVSAGAVPGAHAQTEPRPAQAVRFERLEGLSHNTVFAILQDHRGFLWIGTADGLNRYDGYEMTVYRRDPRDTMSLSNNTVQALAEGADGSLWVGTSNGLDRYDAVVGRFERDALSAGRERLNVQRLAVDSAHALWVQTYGAGLYRYDTSRRAVLRRWRDRDGEPGAVSGTYLRFVDGEGQVGLVDLADGQTHLCTYDVGGDSLRRVALVKPGGGGVVHAGRTALWAVEGATVTRFDRTERRFEPVVQLLADLSAHHRLLEARDGTLWVGTADGVYRVEPAAGTAEHHNLDTSGTAALSNHVLALYEDRAGAVWIGTRSGLYRYDPNEKPFVRLGRGSGLPRAPGSTTIMAVEEDRRGQLWLGTLGGGLLRIDRRTRSVRRFRPPDRMTGGDRIWAVHAGADGTLWLGTDAGLLAFDARTSRFAKQPLPNGSPECTTAVYSIIRSRDGGFRIGRACDVMQVRPDGAHVRHHRVIDPSVISTVQALHEDRTGTLWIGTERAGLLRYEPDADTLIAYPFGAGDSTGLAGETVWTIHESPRPTRPGGEAGSLWLGTDLGLTRFDPRTETFTHFYDPDVLPGALVYSVAEDDQGRLWLGTNQGLARFDPATGRFHHYDADDGIGNTEFNRRAVLRSADGTLFFGGLGGVTSFRPAAIHENSYVPPVLVTEAVIEGDDGMRRQRLLGRDRFRLHHGDTAFELSFAALNFTDSHKNWYAYRLEGFDESWVEAGTRRRARYVNVPPGDYVFRVRGANNDGRWNMEGASVAVVVAPAFWQTWWFRALAAVAIVAALAAAYRYRVSHLLAMERLRLRIASDLHDDVGSKLSSLALMSEMVRDRAALSDDDRRELTRIGHVARRLTAELREIVWFVDPEHDSDGNLRRKMKNTAASLLGEVSFTFRCPDDHLLRSKDAAFRRNVFLIYKEALHNVARHAQAETVEIHVRQQAGCFELTVADDGRGFDPEAASAGHGLRNMRLRAKKAGGGLEIESEPGEGTRVRLTVPVR